MSNKAPRGGWWGFGTEHIADISATICWKISISDKSVYILKLQYCQYHKVYFCLAATAAFTAADSDANAEANVDTCICADAD